MVVLLGIFSGGCGPTGLHPRLLSAGPSGRKTTSRSCITAREAREGAAPSRRTRAGAIDYPAPGLAGKRSQKVGLAPWCIVQIEFVGGTFKRRPSGPQLVGAFAHVEQHPQATLPRRLKVPPRRARRWGSRPSLPSARPARQARRWGWRPSLPSARPAHFSEAGKHFLHA